MLRCSAVSYAEEEAEVAAAAEAATKKAAKARAKAEAKVKAAEAAAAAKAELKGKEEEEEEEEGEEEDESEEEDEAEQLWAQCDACAKWRRLPESMRDSDELDEAWTCAMHPDPALRWCEMAEEGLGKDEVTTQVEVQEQGALRAYIVADDARLSDDDARRVVDRDAVAQPRAWRLHYIVHYIVTVQELAARLEVATGALLTHCSLRTAHYALLTTHCSLRPARLGECRRRTCRSPRSAAAAR